MPNVSLDLLNHKIDQIQEEQEATVKRVSDVREGLYNPNSGLFSRVKSMEEWAEAHEERDKQLMNRLNKMAQTMEPLVYDFKLRQSRQKWTNKILWFLITAALLTAIPSAKYLLFDAMDDSKRLDRIEKLLENKKQL